MRVDRLSGELAMWWETHRGVVHPWYCDQFDHMNVRWYSHFFDDAAFHIWPIMGYSLNKMQANGFHTVVASTTIEYLKELRAGDLLYVKSAFVRVGTKSCTYFQKLFNTDTDDLHATQEAVEVFFDPKSRKAAAMPAELRTLLEANLADKDDA
jgi:acyl-CoA thioester hydrolase